MYIYACCKARRETFSRNKASTSSAVITRPSGNLISQGPPPPAPLCPPPAPAPSVCTPVSQQSEKTPEDIASFVLFLVVIGAGVALCSASAAATGDGGWAGASGSHARARSCCPLIAACRLAAAVLFIANCRAFSAPRTHLCIRTAARSAVSALTWSVRASAPRMCACSVLALQRVCEMGVVRLRRTHPCSSTVLSTRTFASNSSKRAITPPLKKTLERPS